MAKSLRSKWRRKCRAVKRERYDKKELERLKKTLTNDPAHKPEDAVAKAVEDDVIMFVDKKDIVSKKNNEKPKVVVPADVEEDENDDSVMEVVSGDKADDKGTTKDKNGGYPIWYSQRRIKAAKRTAKLRAGKIKKKTRR